MEAYCDSEGLLYYALASRTSQARSLGFAVHPETPLEGSFKESIGFRGSTLRRQYPLIKEYSVNHIRDRTII